LSRFGAGIEDFRRFPLRQPRHGDGKCFDESDEINIERTQNRCLRAARPVIAIPFSQLFHAAPMMCGGFIC
jgi:hypothetical protein